MALPCVVHLDLKGAPLQLDYLRSVITFMKDHGAWGVLIEWEDTFPFTEDLTDIGSLGGCSQEGMYCRGEVTYIIQYIKDKEMEPIQLVQTIGHMEYVLKHGKYRRLREIPRSPAVLCPSRPQSRALVEAMVEQVLHLQPDAKYLHIGADEAWHMNMCPDCQAKTQGNDNGPACLYLDHVKAVATFIKSKYPDINILMWDDMLRNVPVDVMKGFGLGELVQPVVWNYDVRELFRIGIRMWERYSFVFPKVWVASAYKGANGSCQLICSSKRYASNQLAWHEELSIYEGEIKFVGIILTGWSRYDHYAALCELLPEALPSLATCLRMWTEPNGFENGGEVVEMLPLESWPGHEVSSAIRATHDLRERTNAFLNGDQISTWLNTWQVQHDYTSPMQAEAIANTAQNFKQEMISVRRDLATSLSHITGRRSVDELVQTYLGAVTNRLADVAARASQRAAAPAGVAPKYETDDIASPGGSLGSKSVDEFNV